MSENDLPPGSVNLEDDPEPQAPPAAPVAEPEPPAPIAAAPPAEPDSDPDPRVNGLIQAVKAERQKAKDLAAKAARADQLAQELAQAQPYVDFLRANPGVMQPRQEAPPPAPDPTADPDAIEAARLMDFYKADGSPDVERGARYLALQDRRAQAAAQHAVGPIQRTTAEAQADVNYARVLQIKDAAGNAPSKESVDAAWKLMDKKDLADPQVAAVVSVIALGLDRMRPLPPAPAPHAPLVTEPSGGAPRGTTTLSPMQQRIAAQRGVSQADFLKQMQGFQPGRPTILEND